MSKTFRVTPKRIKRSNGAVLTPENVGSSHQIINMKRYLLFLLITFSIVITSCSKADPEKEKLENSIISNLSSTDKLNLLILYSDKDDIDDAKREVGRVIGCTKSTINRVLNSESIPSQLMQNEINNAYRASINKKNLKSIDRTKNFWQKYLIFWHTPDTTDNYSRTINPLYEVLP